MSPTCLAVGIGWDKTDGASEQEETVRVVAVETRDHVAMPCQPMTLSLDRGDEKAQSGISRVLRL